MVLATAREKEQRVLRSSIVLLPGLHLHTVASRLNALVAIGQGLYASLIGLALAGLKAYGMNGPRNEMHGRCVIFYWARASE